MRVGLIAEKVGMTQFFDDNGVLIPVTVLKSEPCTVVALRTKEKNGYNAVQLGTREDPKGKHINRPQLAYFEKLGVGNFRILKEFKVDEPNKYNVGNIITVTHFQKGDDVDVSGVSKGKGFAGAMKRHNFGGLRATHGVSLTHRSLGSVGNRTLPGRIFKGKRMAGHMGNKKVTILNLKIFGTDAEKNLIYVVGAVPGSKGSIVYIRDAIKKPAVVR